MKKFVLVCLMLVMGIAFAQAEIQKKDGKKAKTEQKAEQKTEQKTVVFATSLDCPNCAKKVENTLPYVKGVKDVKIELLTREVTVTYDTKKCDEATLIAAFEKIDIKAEPKVGK